LNFSGAARPQLNSISHGKLGWDAMKKSLDAARKPVNLKRFRGIKALCQRSFVNARSARIDSIISATKVTSAGNFSVTFQRLVVIKQ
jgi:hypothetical protein